MPVITINQQPTESESLLSRFSPYFPSLHFCFFLRPPCCLWFSAHAELRVPRILNLGRKQLLALLTALAGKEGRWERDGTFFSFFFF